MRSMELKLKNIKIITTRVCPVVNSNKHNLPNVELLLTRQMLHHNNAISLRTTASTKLSQAALSSGLPDQFMPGSDPPLQLSAFTNSLSHPAPSL